MRYIASIAILLIVCSGCSGRTDKREQARVVSPDGQSTAIVTIKESFGVQLPGPEPARRKACWSRLTIETQGKTVFDSGFKSIGEYQHDSLAIDLKWSDDSNKLIYRCVNELFIIGIDGTNHDYSIINDDALVSSFKWLPNDQLLIVAKGLDEPLDTNGYPVYHGYIANATDVRIMTLDMAGQVKERYRQNVTKPTFIFNSTCFMMDEISPYSSRVAFSDGKSICVYDLNAAQIIAETKIDGSIEGVWWVNDNHLIVGVGLLSSSNRRFFTVDIDTQQSTDMTSVLKPLWDGMWQDKDWFRPAMPLAYLISPMPKSGSHHL